MAINIGPAINDMRVCELCNSDHIQHPNDLKPREGWTYKGTQVGRISLEQINDGNGCELSCG